jgi:hypothetical protein
MVLLLPLKPANCARGKWKRKLVSVSENGNGNRFPFWNQIPFHIPEESSTGEIETGTGFRFAGSRRVKHRESVCE